ncbi:MAG: ABC transporter ATP-binding protein [Calditrichaeota bacterium]|nr:MAG: ABC transporter ATP-binding protein [Calditrichota bacterium]MBL1206059.1 ABC transporter ATP-binding protein [Calditrichota bacterium]NOG45886.1 ABC transporter ATP-binding protein [Calditrichota bacterium]
MIDVKNLFKSYGPVVVLKGINLTIDQQGIVAVLGPNGSGKTTLIKTILGMVISQKGEILLNGDPVKNKWLYRNQISYMPQIANFPQNLKVLELIGMIKNLRGQTTKDKELIEQFGLETFLDKKLGTLSGGTRQKVNIVLTFMFDSPLIILDEPTTGLDPVALIHLKKLLSEEKQKGKTILITTHIMNLVEEISDQVIFLLDGTIYFNGTVASLKEQTGQKNLEHAIATILKENND